MQRIKNKLPVLVSKVNIPLSDIMDEVKKSISQLDENDTEIGILEETLSNLEDAYYNLIVR